MARFKVLRGHIGDRAYAEGDVREAAAVDVAYLVKNAVLAEIMEGPSDEAQPQEEIPAKRGRKARS